MTTLEDMLKVLVKKTETIKIDELSKSFNVREFEILAQLQNLWRADFLKDKRGFNAMNCTAECQEGLTACHDHCPVPTFYCHEHCKNVKSQTCHEHCIYIQSSNCHDHCNTMKTSYCHGHCEYIVSVRCHEHCMNRGTTQEKCHAHCKKIIGIECHEHCEDLISNECHHHCQNVVGLECHTHCDRLVPVDQHPHYIHYTRQQQQQQQQQQKQLEKEKTSSTEASIPMKILGHIPVQHESVVSTDVEAKANKMTLQTKQRELSHNTLSNSNTSPSTNARVSKTPCKVNTIRRNKDKLRRMLQSEDEDEDSEDEDKVADNEEEDDDDDAFSADDIPFKELLHLRRKACVFNIETHDAKHYSFEQRFKTGLSVPSKTLMGVRNFDHIIHLLTGEIHSIQIVGERKDTVKLLKNRIYDFAIKYNIGLKHYVEDVNTVRFCCICNSKFGKRGSTKNKIQVINCPVSFVFCFKKKIWKCDTSATNFKHSDECDSHILHEKFIFRLVCQYKRLIRTLISRKERTDVICTAVADKFRAQLGPAFVDDLSESRPLIDAKVKDLRFKIMCEI